MNDFADLIQKHHESMAAFHSLPRIDQLKQLIEQANANLCACIFCGNFQGAAETENLLATYRAEHKSLKEEKDGTKTT